MAFDFEDDYRSGCRNVSHCHQQFFSELHSPRQSHQTNHLVKQLSATNLLVVQYRYECPVSSQYMVGMQLVGFALPCCEGWMASDVQPQHDLEGCAEEHVCMVTVAVLILVSLRTVAIALLKD